MKKKSSKKRLHAAEDSSKSLKKGEHVSENSALKGSKRRKVMAEKVAPNSKRFQYKKHDKVSIEEPVSCPLK
ncbi:conserved hypothetical protein, partial [Ricinus communis]